MRSSAGPRVVIVGGGPAGLAAAEAAAASEIEVHVFDAMPSCGRKLLIAGKGGLNLTHSEGLAAFSNRYGARSGQLRPALRAFGPASIRAWAQALGIDTFIGSSGRVFPAEMKAAPLLRRWLTRLRAAGVTFHQRWRWVGFTREGALAFQHARDRAKTHEVDFDACVLALGGASWPQLGSDGEWCATLAAHGVAVTPLAPANCGFDCAFSTHLTARFAGSAVKSIAARCGTGARAVRGEFMLTATGIEGGVVYAWSAALREACAERGHAELAVDLLPDRTEEQIEHALAAPRGSRSLARHLERRLGLRGVKAALLRECASADELRDARRAAALIKALPLAVTRPRPLAEAISSAGGVSFEAVDEHFMLRTLPGVFCAGEMLDWEAPTGGYLLTACLATGRAAGAASARFACDSVRLQRNSARAPLAPN